MVLTMVLTIQIITIFVYSNELLMATAIFRLRNDQTDNSTIYVYLSIKRGKQFLISTGLTINPKDWKATSKSLTGFPKNVNSPNIKNLKTDLLKLESHLLSEVNKAYANGVSFNSNWVKEQINTCFDRQTQSDIQEQKNKIETNKLTVQTQFYIEDAPTYIHRGGKVGLSENRIKALTNFKKIIEDFETEMKTTVYLRNVDFEFEKKFNKWILEIRNYAPNYGGSIIRDLKAVGNYAKKKGVEVSPHIAYIHKYKQQKSDKIIHTFSFAELEVLENLQIDNERLDNARKWIIFGCNIGQRVEDLINITLKNFVAINDKKYIELTQDKTKKEVLIPITKQCERILKTGLPYKVSQQKLNKYIKEVCKLAEINEVVKGDLYDKNKKRKVRGLYPKYKLITSHSFRRSYATNNYIDIPTPVIMEITGHSKESTFLEYINKPVDKTRNANLMLELMELAEQKRAKKKETNRNTHPSSN